MNTWDGLPPMCTACGEPKRRLKLKPDGIYTAACGPCEIDMTNTTALATVPTPDLAPIHREALTVTGAARTIAAQAKAVFLAQRVTDASTMQQATDWIRQLRGIAKALEAERKEKTKPLVDYLEALRSWWRQPLKDYAEAEAHLRTEVNAFEARRAAELAAQLTQAQSQAELQRSVEALAVTPEKMHFREDWSVRVVDRMKVPFEFWKVDEEALHAKVRAEKGAFAVPGCEAVCEKKAVVR